MVKSNALSHPMTMAPAAFDWKDVTAEHFDRAESRHYMTPMIESLRSGGSGLQIKSDGTSREREKKRTMLTQQSTHASEGRSSDGVRGSRRDNGVSTINTSDKGIIEWQREEEEEDTNQERRQQRRIEIEVKIESRERTTHQERVSHVASRGRNRERTMRDSMSYGARSESIKKKRTAQCRRERKSYDGSSRERESQQEPEEQISSGDRRNIEEGQMRENTLS
jgi:hypothetical protein